MALLWMSILVALGARGTLEARLFSPSGINNRGSSLCRDGSMAEIKTFLSSVPDAQEYNNGFHIACSSISGGLGGTCAFLQKASGLVNGKQIKELITLLANHKDTTACGSVPVSLLPEHGQVNELNKMGMLTVNYVANTDNPCPPGPCEGFPTAETCPLKPKTLRRNSIPIEMTAPEPRSPSRLFGRQSVDSPINGHEQLREAQALVLGAGTWFVRTITSEALEQGTEHIHDRFNNVIPGLLVPRLADSMSTASLPGPGGRLAAECVRRAETLLALQTPFNDGLSERK